MPDRVMKVLSDVFGVPVESLTNEKGPGSISQWDSMGHINLMLALESEFGITLSPDDASNMLSVGVIKKVLLERGVKNIT